jgi:hypothetical protein
MLGAVQTPGVHILGHPRGRMYGSRPGVTAEWERVFDAAARLGVAIELDGDPARQDLDYDLARRRLPRMPCLRSTATRTPPINGGTPRPRWRMRGWPGVPRDRVINCWPLSRLLDWAQQRSLAA